MAVRVATEASLEFLSAMANETPSSVKNAAEKHLGNELVTRWQKSVEDHYNKNPFLAEELDRVEQQLGGASRDALTADGRFYLAYGATLLVAAIADTYAIYMQLGDGNILAVSDIHSAAEEPLERDESLIANETTSLCQPNAQRLFRSRFQYFGGPPPALVILSTDGYANSFASEGDFQRVGVDILDIVKTESGWERVENELETWLDEASASGSGDDVTVGLICRDDVIAPAKRKLRRRNIGFLPLRRSRKEERTDNE